MCNSSARLCVRAFSIDIDSRRSINLDKFIWSHANFSRDFTNKICWTASFSKSRNNDLPKVHSILTILINCPFSYKIFGQNKNFEKIMRSELLEIFILYSTGCDRCTRCVRRLVNCCLREMLRQIPATHRFSTYRFSLYSYFGVSTNWPTSLSLFLCRRKQNRFAFWTCWEMLSFYRQI